jgi:hypothetical protein
MHDNFMTLISVLMYKKSVEWNSIWSQIDKNNS